MLLFGQTIGFSKAVQAMITKSLKHIRGKAERDGRVPPGAEIPEEQV